MTLRKVGPATIPWYRSTGKLIWTKTIFTKGLAHARSLSDHVHNSCTAIIHNVIIFFDKVSVKNKINGCGSGGGSGGIDVGNV